MGPAKRVMVPVLAVLDPPRLSQGGNVLVLTRQLGERVIIGDGPDRVIVEVVYLDHGKVRLGIIAPRSVPVHREEIYLLLKEQARRAKDNQDQSQPEGTGH